MSNELLTSEQGVIAVIYNNHSASCGLPPGIDSRDLNNLCTFTNAYGEQWVFFRRGDKYFFAGGDIGWEEPKEVIDGDVPNLILSRPERLFLQAAWLAAKPPHRAAAEEVKTDG